jgi:hypothetical protein
LWCFASLALESGNCKRKTRIKKNVMCA